MSKARISNKTVNNIKVANDWPYCILSDAPDFEEFYNAYAPVDFETGANVFNEDDVKLLTARFIENRSYRDIANEFNESAYKIQNEIKKMQRVYKNRIVRAAYGRWRSRIVSDGNFIISNLDLERFVETINYNLARWANLADLMKNKKGRYSIDCGTERISNETD